MTRVSCDQVAEFRNEHYWSPSAIPVDCPAAGDQIFNALYYQAQRTGMDFASAAHHRMHVALVAANKPRAAQVLFHPTHESLGTNDTRSTPGVPIREVAARVRPSRRRAMQRWTNYRTDFVTAC